MSNAVTLIVDRSGSMMNVSEEMTNQINDYVDKLPDGTVVDVVQFDAEIEKVITGFEVGGGDSLGFVLSPRGATALHDAMGKSFTDALATSKATKHLFIVVTDGHENSSQEFDGKAVATLIREIEDKGWEMLYFGANQDAIVEAKAFGGSASNSITYNATGAGVGAATSTLTASSLRYYAGEDLSFTDAEREATINTK
jgi:hypothetical protein